MGLDETPDRMLAAQILKVIHALNTMRKYDDPYSIHEVPTPKKLDPYDLLVKTAVASLCHTDSMVRAGAFGTSLPCTGSHEGAGTIVATGSRVSMDFKEGDRSAIGVNIDGAFADYVVVDSRYAAKLPNEVSFETAAPLACAGCTIWRGVLQAKLEKGQWLGIVGAGGGLGHLGVQFAKSLGLRVVAVDARDGALDPARECGADVVVDARQGDKDIVEEIKKATGSEGADATVNVSDAKGAAATACAVTKRQGLMIQIAQPETVDIPFAELIFRDVKVQGSLISSPGEAQEMVRVVAEHKISVKTNAFEGLKSCGFWLSWLRAGR